MPLPGFEPAVPAVERPQTALPPGWVWNIKLGNYVTQKVKPVVGECDLQLRYRLLESRDLPLCFKLELVRLRQTNNVRLTFDSLAKGRPCSNVWTQRTAIAFVHNTHNSITLSSCYLKILYPHGGRSDKELTDRG